MGGGEKKPSIRPSKKVEFAVGWGVAWRRCARLKRGGPQRKLIPFESILRVNDTKGMSTIAIN